MSRHSKNNTSQSIFTYGEKQKLKGQYGTKQQRIGQDSIKRFQMCSICNSQFVDPVCCSEGHTFCKSCVIQFMVKQKKKIADAKLEAEIFNRKKQQELELKQLQQKAKKIVKFEKYDNFQSISNRNQFVKQDNINKPVQINPNQSKPVGVYEITSQKQKYVKSSFWATQNTPHLQQKVNKEQIKDIVKCPAGTDHKLTLKKLRNLIAKKMGDHYCCSICNKQIIRQKIGSYKCGHIVCYTCKSNKCQICGKNEGWIQVQSSSSSFAQHKKSQVKTYTHAFYI